MRNTLLLVVLTTSAVLATSPASAQVRLTMADGQVSLSARNATASQILAEWTRVGQTRIVNGERIPGPPLTIELTSIPEAQALDIILRAASGYLLAPRATPSRTASKYDRILIVPTSTATRAAVPAPTAVPAQGFVQPRFNQVASPQDDSDDLDATPPRPAPNGPPNRPQPTFNTFPLPTPAPRPAPAGSLPETNPTPSRAPNTPSMPAGVSTPGMVVPAPPQPGQPGGTPVPQL